jgi:hypothetical protein
MLPALMILGPVVAPLVVAVIVFIVIAAITGTTVASTTSLPTSVRVALAFLVGGFVAAKAHSWAKGQINAAMYDQQHYTPASSAPMMQYTQPPIAPVMQSTGGLPPVNIPAHLMPQ